MNKIVFTIAFSLMSIILVGQNSGNEPFIKNPNDTTKSVTLNSKNLNTGIAKPLIISDGKEISEEAMKKINPNEISSIQITKGEKAIDKFGEKGKNGVIEVILK